MTSARTWCRLTALDADGRPSAVWVMRGAGPPDLAAVDRIARRALAVARRGGRLVVDGAAPELCELLQLAAFEIAGDGAVEVRRQSELGE